MTYAEAKVLRDEIRADGIHCVIPRNVNVRGVLFVVRIVARDGPKLFSSRDEWLEYVRERDERNAKEQAELSRKRRPRSPIEMMIDKACGYIPD